MNNKYLKIAKDCDASAKVLDFLVREKWDAEVFTAVAENFNTATTTLDFMMQVCDDKKHESGSYAVLLAVICNSNTSFTTFKKIADQFHGWSWYEPLRKRKIAISSCHETPPDILDFLAKGQNGNEVCCAIAGNPNTPVNTLVLLSQKYKNRKILLAIANNRNMPKHLLDGIDVVVEVNPPIYDKALQFFSRQQSKFFIENDRMTENEIGDVVLSDDELDSFEDEKDGILDLQNTDFAPTSCYAFSYDRYGVTRYLYVYDIGFEETMEFMKHKQRLKNGEWTSYYHIVETEKSPFKSSGFKIPPQPEPLEFNTDRISEIKTESKKVSAMLNAIYEQDETTSVAEKSAPQTTQPVLNLDETHLEIVKILAIKPEWERNELQKMMKGMMIDGVLEHINEAFFDYCDEAFIEGDDPIEINVELYKEIFK
jgi:hypothetical protein